MDKEPIIAVKEIQFDAQEGKKTVSQMELYKKDLPFGLYVGSEEVAGKALFYHAPVLTKIDITHLNWAISHFERYEELKEDYQKLIETDPAVKWYLIPCLLLNQEHKEQIPDLASLPISKDGLLTEEMKKKMSALSKQGAEYLHCLTGTTVVMPYSVVNLVPFFAMFDQNMAYISAHKFSLILYALISYRDDKGKITTEGKHKIALMLQTGVDINLPIDEYNNSIFLYLIALEDEDLAINFINLHSSIVKQYKGFDFSPIALLHQDVFGKTALLFAVGLGLKKVVDAILRQSQFLGLDAVGLNTPDNKGRTPIMIAAALGRADILNLLLSCGCDLTLKDNLGRDINYYKNAPEEEVRDILSSLSVHPDRVVGKNHSYLYANKNNYPPLVLKDSDQSSEEQLLVISPKPEHFSKLCYVYNKIVVKNECLEKKIDADYLMVQLSPLFLIEEQMISSLTKNIPPKTPTVLEKCLFDQTLTCQLIDDERLRVACALGDVESVKRILQDTKANPFAENLHGINALLSVVMFKQSEIEQIASAQKRDVSVEECLQNHVQVFQLLLDHSEDVRNNVKNAKNNGLLKMLSGLTYHEDTSVQAKAKGILKMVKDFLLKQEENIVQKQDADNCLVM